MATCTKHLWSLLDYASDLIQVIAPDGAVLYANLSWCEVLGYSQEEARNLSFFDLLHSDSYDRFLQILHSLQIGQDSDCDIQTVLLAKNGSPIAVKGRIRYQAENGTSPEIWSLWQSIASSQVTNHEFEAPTSFPQQSLEQKHTQEALQQSEDRYRTVVSALQEGVLLVDSEGRICTCNPSAERILGLSNEPLNVHNFSDLSGCIIHEDGSPFLPENFPAILSLRTGRPYSNVVMGIYKPNGTLNWVSVNAQPLFHSNETTPYGAIASFSDITARKQAEAALQQSEARYRAIVEDQTELVCRFLPDGTLTFANKAYCELLGIPEEELVEHSYKMFLLALDKETQSHLTVANPEHLTSWLEHQVVLPNGEVCWQQWCSRAIFDDLGQCIEFQAVGRDITQRKQMEEALRESEARFQAFMDNSPAVAFIKDEASRLVYVNSRYCQLFGKSQTELIGKNEFDLFPKGIARKLHEQNLHLLTVGQGAELVEKIPDAEGKLREWLSFKFPLSSADGKRLLGE